MSARTLLMLRDQDQIIRDKPAEPQDSPRLSLENAAPRPTQHGATWTDERIAQLKSCVEAGLTCSQIAAEIGVTRNAVIGKMSRLGLTKRRRKMAPREAKPQRVALRTGSLVRFLARQRMFVALNAETACSAGAIAILDGRGCSLFELAPGRCRWPINDPGAADFCFC